MRSTTGKNTLYMEQTKQEQCEYETPGQQWAQRLGVIGGILVLLFSLVFVLTMLMAGPEKLDYTPAHDTAYYMQNMDELQAELEQEVFPHVEGIESCELVDDKLVISIRQSKFIETRAVIIDLFARELFLFEQR